MLRGKIPHFRLTSVAQKRLCLSSLIGSLSKNVFERCTSTGSEPFSLLICLDTTKFVFLCVFSLIKMICPKIWSTSHPKFGISPHPVDVRRSSCLKSNAGSTSGSSTGSRDFLHFWDVILNKVLIKQSFSNTNLVPSTRIKREKGSLPVDRRRQKTSLLKLANT